MENTQHEPVEEQEVPATTSEDESTSDDEGGPLVPKDPTKKD